MRCYLAHPVTEYGSQRQRDAIATIQDRGWTVENPDAVYHQDGYRKSGMDYFTDLVGQCDALVFLRFDCGSISAGVAKEIEAALRSRLPTYSYSDGELVPVGDYMPGPVLSVEETRAKIKSSQPARPSHE